jgi:hypothetical protein
LLPFGKCWRFATIVTDLAAAINLASKPARAEI